MVSDEKYGPAAIRTAGIIFAVTGGLLILVTIVILIAAGENEAVFAPAILGPGFLGLGSIFLVFDRKERRIARELMEAGRYVWGEIVSVERDPLIRVNGAYPWYVRVRYFDGRGGVLIFESRRIGSRKKPDIVGRRIKVYVDDTCQRSYVDLGSVN